MANSILSNSVEALKLLVKEFPTGPGVYLMKGEAEKIIYVGKAKNLRNRVRSYFSGSHDLSPKTKHLINHIKFIETMLTNTEVEAFLLEASLIKKHRPRYNIRLKDDKAYPYIRISVTDKFPRLYLARKVKKDGALYFGPYTSGSAVHATLRFLNQTFRIRDCQDSFMKSRKRPCITHQIGRCTAPCVDLINKEDYGKDVKSAISFLRGQNKKVIKDLSARMKNASSAERFEVAAKLRDSIKAIEAILEKQSVVSTTELDQDVVGFVGNTAGTLVEMLHVRQGRVVGQRFSYLNGFDCTAVGEDPREWLVSYLNQYYIDNFIPDEVLTSVDLGVEVTKLLGQVLHERRESPVRVHFSTTENGHKLVDMVDANAQRHLEEQQAEARKKNLGLELIAQKLGLTQPPRRIECFDISNFQGSDIVASHVVFEDGVPAKDHYRRYKIRGVDGAPNDFESMREVLSRRFAHAEWEFPNLLVIDGGKGQLSVAVEVLKLLNISNVPVVGMAKARTKGEFSDVDIHESEERFFLPGRQNPVTFHRGSEALHILVGLRDEAHRFAITFHRSLREERSLTSELDLIVGLGEKRKKALLKKFQSLDQIRVATVEEIAELPTFNRVLAERILLHLNEESTGVTSSDH